MNYQLLNIVIGGLGFLILLLVQSLCINGVHECFKFSCFDEIHKGIICNGNIFYKMAPKFFKKHKDKTWTLPAYACVKCMGSVWGTITFWIIVYPLFGFHNFELILWPIDLFCLVSLNWFVYKKL